MELTLNQILEQGIVAHNEGRLLEAELSYKKVIEIKLDYTLAHNNLGILLHILGRFDEAEESFKKAIKFRPDYVEAHNNLGNVKFKFSRFDEAEESFKKAIKFKPDHVEAHNNLGKVKFKFSRFDEAEESFKKAIKFRPDYVEAYNNLGVTLNKLGRHDEAETNYKKAIELKPDYAEAYNNLGVILQDLDRYDEAETNYKKAIELKPDYAEAYNNLGVTLKKLGKFTEAIDSYKQAIKLKPDYTEARINRDDLVKNFVPSWHLSMMNDKYRNSKYLEAIKLAMTDIEDSSLVLDIGTGSGLLSMMAAANGGREIIACEISKPIAEIAKKIIYKNGYQEKIKVIKKKSTELKVGEDLPRKADLIISEILSAEFVGEGVRTSILDANKRLLKKNGIMIPQSGTIKISLLGNDDKILDAISATSSNGFDLSEFNLISQRKWAIKLQEKPTLLSNHEDAFTINLYNENNIVEEEKIIELKVNQDGLCLGVIQWMKIQLYKDIEYENNPGKYLSDSTHWPTPIYLFDKPIKVKKGEVLKIKSFLGLNNVWFFYV